MDYHLAHPTDAALGRSGLSVDWLASRDLRRAPSKDDAGRESRLHLECGVKPCAAIFEYDSTTERTYLVMDASLAETADDRLAPALEASAGSTCATARRSVRDC